MVYRLSGYLIFASLIVILYIGKFHEEWADERKLIFWLEWWVITWFGISWLTKAKVFFPEKESNFIEHKKGFEGTKPS